MGAAISSDAVSTTEARIMSRGRLKDGKSVVFMEFHLKHLDVLEGHRGQECAVLLRFGVGLHLAWCALGRTGFRGLVAERGGRRLHR